MGKSVMTGIKFHTMGVINVNFHVHFYILIVLYGKGLFAKKENLLIFSIINATQYVEI